jgi:hypothetical protein
VWGGITRGLGIESARAETQGLLRSDLTSPSNQAIAGRLLLQLISARAHGPAAADSTNPSRCV